MSRETYSSLFSVIGTSFGEGDGEDTFNVPDLRESVPKGVGLTGKSGNHYNDTGLSLGEFIDDRFQAHEHNIGNVGSSSGSSTSKIQLSGYNLSSSGIVKQNNEMGEPRYGKTTEVKSIGVNYIIKY